MPAKLKASALYQHSHYAALIDLINKHVVPHWDATWRHCQAFNSILNKKSLVHEMEESVVALHFVLQMMTRIVANAKCNLETLSIPLVDVCSGKGILSMLVVSFVLLIDKNWDIAFVEAEAAAMRRRHEDPLKPAKCAIKSSFLPLLADALDIAMTPVRSNLHSEAMRQWVEQLACPCVFVCIHLCRRLSVRAIELFNAHPKHALLLAPCCMPLRGGNVVRIGPLWSVSQALWRHAQRATLNVNRHFRYRFGGDGDAKDEEEEEDECCFRLALMSAKRMRARNKRLSDKLTLAEGDMERLFLCEDFARDGDLDVRDVCNEMFVAAELLPAHLHALREEKRYAQWISFLFNGIDAASEHKHICRVPLTGNEHRCDAFIACFKS